MPELSDRQQRILEFIEDFMDESGYPPTIRDIQRGCDISSTSVVDYNLEALHKKGYIRRDAEVSRGLEIIGGGRRSGKAAPETVAVPLMGAIAAGAPFPLPASESFSSVPPEDMIDLPQAIAGTGESLYALKVKGESMIDALISDGDLVIMEDTDEARDGQMVAVRLRDEDTTTLKRIYREDGRVRLQPENSQMQPIIVDARNVEVLSRVVAVWRYLG
ncbi:MAG: transcriptional repressor LexA [Chloroflexota bacterium]